LRKIFRISYMMTRKLKAISTWLLLFPLAPVLSCVAVEWDCSQNQVMKQSGGLAHQGDDALQYAYQSYALACMAILNGDYQQGEIHLKEALKSDERSPYLLKKVSRVLLEQGKGEEALDFAQRAAEMNPDDMDAKGLLAGIYSQLQRFELAISQYREILETDPQNTDSRLQLSTLFIRLKDFDSALGHLEILIKDNPGLLIAHYYMGRIKLERNEYSSAEKAYLRVLEINPEFLPALFDLAVLYGKMDKLDRAIACYKRILAISPTNMTAGERLISLYFKTGQEKAAEEAIKEMEKNLSPGDRERKTLGLIYLKYGKLDESIAELTSIVAAFPEDQEARYYLGAALDEHEDFNEAYKNLTLLGPESNYFVHARIRMAYILQKQGKTDEAIGLLRDTIDLKKGQPRLYLMLSTLYEGREQYRDAMSVLEEGLTHDTRDTNLLYRMGIVLDKLNRNKECLEHMETILTIDPQHADALNYIGYTYADKGIHLDRAQELIEKALKSKPNSGYIIDSLGWVYFRKGLYDRALIELKRAVELTPGDPVITEHLGDVLFKMKQYERALETYNRALALENADAERLKEKIKDVLEHINGDAPQ
jgi:tetratricopeptide (TPR) repeat protein